MAKPIRSTPTLRGDDAKNFIESMLKEQKNPNSKRVNTIKRALNSKFNFI